MNDLNLSRAIQPPVLTAIAAKNAVFASTSRFGIPLPAFAVENTTPRYGNPSAALTERVTANPAAAAPHAALGSGQVPCPTGRATVASPGPQQQGRAAPVKTLKKHAHLVFKTSSGSTLPNPMALAGGPRQASPSTGSPGPKQQGAAPVKTLKKHAHLVSKTPPGSTLPNPMALAATPGQASPPTVSPGPQQQGAASNPMALAGASTSNHSPVMKAAGTPGQASPPTVSPGPQQQGATPSFRILERGAPLPSNTSPAAAGPNLMALAGAGPAPVNSATAGPAPFATAAPLIAVLGSQLSLPPPQPDPAIRVPAGLKELINGCTKMPLSDEEIGRVFASTINCSDPFQAGKAKNIPRSVLKGRYILMTHCKKGGDRCLGTGSFKKAKYAVDTQKQGRKVVAVFRKAGQAKATPFVRREIAFMEMCAQIEEVAHLDDHFETNPTKDDQGKIYFIMKEYNRGSLRDMLESLSKSQAALSDENRLNIALDVAKGLEGMHKLRLLHRDIKTHNVFLFDEPGAAGQVKLHARLADLGLCCKEDDMKARGKLDGTHGWFSREIAQLCVTISSAKEASDQQAALKKVGIMRTQESDVEAVGYLLYQLFHPQHARLPHLNSALSAQLKEQQCAQLLIPAELAKVLAPLKPEHRAILMGIFTEHWNAAKLREELERLKK